ncbi:MAG: hemerythrin domain-containing protein [Saprospiraceae bacterium]|nr:hemerythrin domain-containing protein [Saprospiraceae bacterium]
MDSKNYKETGLPKSRLEVLREEHQLGLQLCTQIRAELNKKKEHYKLQAKCICFWNSHLKYHLEFEEHEFYPLFPKEYDYFIKRAIREHQKIKRLFAFRKPSVTINLSLLEEELTNHIMFEERFLFKPSQ